LPNHNIDPTQLGSYVHAWTQTFNANEGFFAKPLTYTPNGYTHELVIVASTQNILRVLDSVTGNVLFSRTLDPPFASSDSSCGDINPTIGITGTPIIDPATDTMYFFSKGYKNAGATGSGTLNGVFKASPLHTCGTRDHQVLTISRRPVQVLRGQNSQLD
jgi:hypothetical protein